MRYWILYVSLLAASQPVYAGQAIPWTVNDKASSVGFVATMNGQPITGRFGRFKTQITFDPRNLAGSSVTATIDMNSARTGDQTRDESLPTSDWFNVSLFPRATFSAQKFKDLGSGNFMAVGILTIRGIAKPVSMPFHLNINGDLAKMQGRLVIDRRAFGVGLGQFSTTEAVAADVKINVNIFATKASRRVK